ncbi:hypothetical protein B0H66DRAFT_552648 [Apodospora peruviana]|uniref:Infection structure specific protein n=1 Tax=Apodospora peruviana TaxID=516989 RepID=A0AAE0IAY0_9PEZI|nr:hypothetical protein B0H66DRAFT_552648 [Apodospora peruviana]
MYTALLTVALAAAGASALAAPAPAPAPMITIAPAVNRIPSFIHNAAQAAAAVEARQIVMTSITLADAKATACARSYTSFIRELPLPTGSLLSWAATAGDEDLVTVTDIKQVDEMCSKTDTLTPPASLASAYKAYESEVSAWATSVQSEAHSLAQSCGSPIGPMFDMLVATDAAACKSAASAYFGAPTGSGNAGPRETGCMVAAAAVAGVVGVMAAM